MSTMSEAGTSGNSSRLQSNGGSVEGSQVEESGPQRKKSLDVINEYREVYNECIKKIEECCDDQTKVINLLLLREVGRESLTIW